MMAMKLTSPSVVRRILQEHGLRPRRRWGQHFLCDENVLNKVVEAAGLSPEDRVFEIGAGLGTLTQRLATEAKEVVAVEIDPKLTPILREQLAEHPNVRIVEADVLKLDWASLFPPGEEAKALGNLPYGITSPVLEGLIGHRDLFSQAVLMIQLEVAEKLMAPPGRRGASSLGVFVQAYCDVEQVMRISRSVFVPRPEVDSALVRLTFLESPRFQAPEERFLSVVHAAFGMRRKTILRALVLCPRLPLTLRPEQARGILEHAGIEETRRGETLTIEEFDRLALALYELEKHSSSRRKRS
jgi:16S rRNA (adenine1518-N6/adenine1519-N6)-dimethyltransferase